MSNYDITVVGAGLAGSETAWQLAQRGLKVRVVEMKPLKFSSAHHYDGFAELVCSNSFRGSDPEQNAVGLLQEELKKLDSIVIHSAHLNRVPAGGALAVDREKFSSTITNLIKNHQNIIIENKELTSLPKEHEGPFIIATGPLTSEALFKDISDKANGLSHFFDAIAPIIYKDSIDFSKAWFQSRYDKGEGKDYINCPLSKKEYYDFVNALAEGEKTEFHDWEKNTPYFEGCLPIEIMASRGVETLSFGPMKPVGLTNPHKDEDNQPYAVVQIRQDNKEGTLYNMVGFQTKLKHSSQKDIFRKIAGLENAEFARLGGIHRNSFISSPELLDEKLRLKNQNNIRFAGQITGCEGYVESTAIGLLSAIFAYSEINGTDSKIPPQTTAIGALLNHVVNYHGEIKNYQPMNVNFGLFPQLEKIERNGKKRHLKGKDKRKELASRARFNFDSWMQELK